MDMRSTSFLPQQEELEKLQKLYLEGKYLTVYRLATELAPLKNWHGKEGRIMAARIAVMMNQRSLSDILYYRAWKEFPDDPETIYEVARNKRRLGPYPAWKFMQKHDDKFSSNPDMYARWLGLKANILARLRDFSQANDLMQQAMILSSDRRLRCEYAYILEFEDRYDESLEVINELLEEHTLFRAAWQQKAFLLQLMRKDDEAGECLQQCYTQFESIHIGAQWLDELIEQKEYEHAMQIIDELEIYVLSDRKHENDWLISRKIDMLCHLDRYEEAKELAPKLKSKFFIEVLENLNKASPDSKRAMLPVTFIRQRHNTCGPATMSAICHFHGSKVDQQTIIDSIWYDGTWDVDERNWCLENGWQVREFKLTWESTINLIDAGFPVAVTTVEPDSAHLQAIIGYDEFRGTLLIRDPFERDAIEAIAKDFFEEYQVYGPRTLLIYPQEKIAQINEIELPECEQYDHYFQFQCHLKDHQRAEAFQILQEMEKRWPGSRMSLIAKRRLGNYDGNSAYSLSAIEELLKLYPDDARLQLYKSDMLYQLGYVSERKNYLDTIYKSDKMHSSLEIDYIEMMLEDKRQSGVAYQLIRSLLYKRAYDPLVYYRFSGLRWAERDFDETMDLHQIAANLASYDEFYALKYFDVAHALHRENEVLHRLIKRHTAALGKSSQPTITLYKALSKLDREPEGFEYLTEALEKMPDDIPLNLFVCNKYIDSGEGEKAQALLDKMKGQTRDIDWLTTAAYLAEHNQDYASVLELSRQVVELQPQNEDLQRRYANMIGRVSGYSEKIAYLESLVKTWPDSFDFYELLLDSMEQATPEQKIKLLNKMLNINSDHAWAQRELAIQLGYNHQLDEAFVAINRAEGLDPHNPGLYSTRGDLHIQNNDIPAARKDFKRAIELSVDATYAAKRFVETSIGIEEKRDALNAFRNELIKQVTNGNAILRYASIASEVISDEEIRAHLQEALDARPDLWEAWVAMMGQYQTMVLYEEAEQCAQTACERFPFVPRLWLERSYNFRLQGDYEQEQKYLRRALEINPNYSTAIRSLSDNLEHQGKYEEALELLQNTIQHHQLDEVMHGFLGDLLWRTGNEHEGFDELKIAAQIDPEYNWAWNTLRDWAQELGRQDEMEKLAEDVVKQRPGDSHAWQIMARHARDFERTKQCMEKAIKLSPSVIEYRQEYIKQLVNGDAYQEALAAFKDAGELTEDISLKVYYPWILRCMGKVEEAVEKQQAIMQENPEYADGWRVLSRWARALKNKELELEAARNFARLEAHNVCAINRYADVLLELEQIDEAIKQYKKALAIEPKDVDANLELFDLYLTHDYLDEAEQLLENMRTHFKEKDVCYIDARNGQLLALQGKKDEAIAQLKQLAQSSHNNTWLIESIQERMDKQGWTDEVNALIDEWVEDIEHVGPSLTRVWVDRKSKNDDWLLAIDSIKKLMQAGEGGVYVVDGFLDYLIDKDKEKLFVSYVEYNKRVLKKHDQTWASVGYYYTNLQMYDEAIQWMSGWKKRDVLQTWALRNLALCYRHRFNWKKCMHICKHGLELEDGNGQNSMRIWMAFEYAMTNRLNQFYNMLTIIDEEDFSPSEKFIHSLLEVVAEFEEAKNKKAFLDEAIPRLKTLRDEYEYYDGDPPSQRCYRRLSYELASRVAGFPGKIFWFARMML